MVSYACTFLVLLFVGLTSGAQPDCNKFYKGPGPQSTFQMPEDGQGCSNARTWIIAPFKATSNTSESSLDVRNFTATVTRTLTQSGAEYETSITMCSTTGDSTISESKNPWPNGSYCIPVASTVDCKDHLTKHELTVKAPGRKFDCGEKPSPLFNCTDGSFGISACCPKNMTGEPYLTVPFYNSTFYLFKANASCPEAFSFTVKEENIALSNATAVGDMAQYIKSDNDSISLHFCKYTPVKCAKRPAAFATYTMFDGCIGDSRGQITGCLAEAVLQPDDDGTILYSKCLPSGQYSDSDMFCGKQCPALEPPTNSTLSTNSTDCDVTVMVSCGDGSVVTGHVNTTCLRDGTWSNNITLTTCLYVECPESELSTSSHKEWTGDGSNSSFSYGHSVQYWCDNRQGAGCYHLEDDVRFIPVTCQANGTWTDIPKCYRGGQCSNPGNTSFAIVNSTAAEFNCDEVVTYTCPAHHVSKTPLTLTCLPDKTQTRASVWDNSPPECNLTVCGDPQLYLNDGEVEGIAPPRNSSQLNNTQFNVGDVVGYQCNVLYSLRGDEEITCQSDGTWNTTTTSISCWKVECPAPPANITHGSRTDQETEYILGTQITYSCEGAGVEVGRYELNYTDTVACNDQGHWEPYIPTCVEVTCETPPFVNHSIASPGPFKLYSVYHYTCKPGFSITDPAALVCGIGGWNDTNLPTCAPVLCNTAPPSVVNGSYNTSYNASTFSYNTEAAYTCSQGYNSSTSVTVCSQTGSWSPPPACSPVFCDKPAIPHSVVSVTKDFYSYNENITVTCSKHMVYHPPQLFTCSDDGGWATNGTKVIDCYMAPVTEPQTGVKHDRYIFIGGGGVLFIILIGVIIFFVRRKRKAADLGLEPFADTRQFSVNVNPHYKASKQEVKGFENPGFEEEPVHSFSINKNKSKLVLHDEAGYTTIDHASNKLSVSANRLSNLSQEAEQREWADSSTSSLNYDTLRSRNIKPTIVSEPLEGEYNTLSRMNMTRPEYDDEGHYNVISTSPPQMDDDEDIYNIPTNSMRGTRQPLSLNVYSDQSEVNEVYSNKSAAQLCGTPIEEDFDNMIYDNI